jgi:hypothetical protein
MERGLVEGVKERERERERVHEQVNEKQTMITMEQVVLGCLGGLDGDLSTPNLPSLGCHHS